MPKRKELTGKRFGHLTVTGPAGERENGYQVWNCRCDCGGEIRVDTKRLEHGTVTDCGCIPKQNARRGNRAEDLAGQRFGFCSRKNHSFQKEYSDRPWAGSVERKKA